MIDPRSALSAAFAKTILSRENRPIRLRWSQRETHFEELLLVQRVEIREAMFEGMHGHLTCISIDPDLPLHELLGQPLGIEMVNDRGGLHHINGIITEARAGQADGALRVYHLTLRDAMSIMDGRINSRTFLIRSGDFSDAYNSLAQEKESPTSLTEKSTLTLFPTAHQKTALIDYDYQGGAHAVGYVMGLNSVTDYWDTKKHLFQDPRRGQSWEGGGDELPGLKPFQDYACRINGEVLINVSKNFVDAWNRVASRLQKIAREHDLHSPPAGLKIRAGKSRHRAQIVRTQIEEGDKSIKRLYRQATSFATNYIYIENQYFQYAEWVRYLKQLRRDYVAGWKAAGQSLKKLPDLHVFVVIPTPEKPNMVPATHEAVKELGHGMSMPNQDKKSEEKLIVQQQPRELERYVFRNLSPIVG